MDSPLTSSSLVGPPLKTWLPSPINQTELFGTIFAELINYQNNYWALVSSAPGVDIGTKTEGDSERLFPPYGSASLPQSSGFLGNVSTAYYTPSSFYDFNSTNVTFVPRPYFFPVSTPSEINSLLLQILDSFTYNVDNLTVPDTSDSDSVK